MKSLLVAVALTAAMMTHAWADRLAPGIYLIPVFVLPNGDISVRSDLARKRPDAETCEMRMTFASNPHSPTVETRLAQFVRHVARGEKGRAVEYSTAALSDALRDAARIATQ